MSVLEKTVTAELVRAAEVALTGDYNALFKAYPTVISIYNRTGAKTAYVIRQLYNQQTNGLALADDPTVMRLLSMYSYLERKPIPANLILVDDEYAIMLLVGKTLGYLKIPG